MSNSYYQHGTFPTTGSFGASANMRGELDNVTAGFDNLPNPHPSAPTTKGFNGGTFLNPTISGGTMTDTVVNEAAPVSLASAATVSIGAATSNNVTITGAVAITAFGTVGAGICRKVKFTGTPVITYNAVSMILPGAANITAQAGDEAMFRSLGSGDWECISYTRADGSPLRMENAIHAAPASVLVDTDEVGFWDSATSLLGKITWANLKFAVFTAWGALIAAGTAKVTPVDADAFAMMDSAAGNATKSLTVANLKATLKTYFDGLYPASYFRPHAKATPDMTVLIDAGKLQNSITKVSQAQQTTTTFTAPSANPRNDLIVIDQATAAYSIVAGTESASPSDPAIPSGKIAIARVRMATSTTSITDSLIDDLRPGVYIPASSSGASIQGVIKNLNAYSTGLDAHYYASIDEIALEDGSNNYITRRNVFYDINTAAAAGANALDTGTVAANSWYSVWALYNPTTLTDAAVAVLAPTLTGNTTSGSVVVAALSSTASMRVGMPIRSANFPAGTVIKTVDSASQVTMSKPATGATTGVNIEFVYDPVMPSGYTYKARIGWLRTDSTANKYPLCLIQHGGQVQYVTATGSNVSVIPQMASGAMGNVNTPTWSAVSTGGYIPPTAKSIRIGIALAVTGQAMAAPNANAGAYTSTTNPAPLSTPYSNGSNGTFCAEFLLETSNIFWASGQAGNNLLCSGWDDDL